MHGVAARVHWGENVAVAELLVGVDVTVDGTEVGGTEELWGGTTEPLEHRTVVSFRCTAVCA
jgi:hypothetical protein